MAIKQETVESIHDMLDTLASSQIQQITRKLNLSDLITLEQALIAFKRDTIAEYTDTQCKILSALYNKKTGQ